MSRRWMLVLRMLAIVAAVTPVTAATTGSLTVLWNANTTDTDLAGYRIYLSTDSGVFSLSPAQAAAASTVRVVGASTTQSLFTSLDPTKVYWIAVTSFDTSANESGFSNVVSAQPRDVTSPTVALTAPNSGATVLGTITVSANASDDVGVAGVQFMVDGNNIGQEDSVAPYSVSWNTSTIANGAHTLSAVARDAAGNSTTSATRSVTLNNPDTTPPSVSLTAPAGGATILGVVTVSAGASDNVGVAGVQFLLDGVNLGLEDTVAPYAVSWSTTPNINGPHALTARARDVAGNKTTSAAVNVTVNNPDLTAPIVSLTAPVNGATVLGMVTVSASASDNVGVAGVQFRLDGNNLGSEDTVAPYSIAWDASQTANGSHTLTAVARDAAGNSTTSLTRSVTVNNPDTIPPTVSLTAPAGGSTLVGTITVSANALDNVGVAGVQFKLDGVNLGLEDTIAPYATSWNTNGTINGAHSLTAVARDAAANKTTSGAVSVTVNNPDLTPPTVGITAPASGASVLGMVTVSATATDNQVVAGVQFKLDGNDLGAEDTVAPYTVAWDAAQTVNGSHKLNAVARDAAGNVTISADRNVTVNNPDLTPPTVAITSPASGSTALGMIFVSADALDNVGVAGVLFKLDGVNLGVEDTTAPYSISWNTNATINGPHLLTAVARDTSSNRTTSIAVSVTVNNPDLTPPTVAMTAPINGSTVVGVVIVSANASDNMGVAGVQFQLDGADLDSEDDTPPYAITWSTTTVANGTHSLRAVARDAAGNTTTSVAFNVMVSNSDLTPPTISITAPLGGASVSDLVQVSADASDNVGVIAVQFELDGSNLANVFIAPPYSFSWDTKLVNDGLHTLTAVARDAAGNTTTSAPITVDVSNTLPSACVPGLDPDGDGVCTANDNCPNVYNPSQTNTDGDNEGGDACDISITFPTNGALTCADGPPTITWTPEIYHLFKVFVGTTVSYSVGANSGKKWLTANSWTMPATKWAAVCKSARPFLFIKVLGRNSGSIWFEYSETSTIVAK